jgi:mono/diheme cytochrome c family protein
MFELKATLIALVALATSPLVRAKPATPPQTSAVLTEYCLTCHNEKLKTAGFALDPAAVAHAADNAELWEKVIRKLRTNAMPPPGVPRPDAATLASVASHLESELDRASAAKPNPGKLPLLHRLTRMEYQNAIRDLLSLNALPKEMDYSLLLPADNSSSGFDNIADLLFVSPTAMERYLDAAQKISSLAIGDPAIPVMVNRYPISGEQPQDARIDELPFGTRGGLAVRSDFPLDGEYVVKVEFAGIAQEPEQLEISVDGERIQLVPVAANAPPAGRVGGRRPYRGALKPQEFRIPVKAGPRLMGITFINQNDMRDEETLRPQMRDRGTRLAIAGVTISGPYGAKAPGDTPSRSRIFVCRPATAAEELPCAKRILSTLERRAYRRPVTEQDVEPLLPFYTAGRAEGSFDLGIERALERLLVSPQFLFRIEHDPAGIAPGTSYLITDLELASRLSFFLWSSIPDDELLDVAIHGKLSDPAVLRQQTRRMLADPRSQSLVTNFAEQWLFLRDIESKTPDDLMFQNFDESLRQAFRRETDLFLDSVLRGNRSILELISANYTFLNERLAKHYGIPHVEGSYFRRVELPSNDPRGGLLGQGSILTITSYATRTSPVVRGKWVLENLLASAPPPPPANVPALKTEGSEAGKTLTMREALTQHRANPACAGCHARMDPIGFAMENFDAIGRWRDRDAGKPIDTSGVLPDGTKLDGMAGLKKALLRQPELFVSTAAAKLLMYGTGRNIQYYDQPAIRAIVREAAANNNTMESLVMGVVSSAPFQMRESTSNGDRK